MATLKQEILFYNDTSGKVRPGAKIYAFDSVATTTAKKTYTTSDLTVENAHPVVADGAGVFPPIWLESGGYRIVWKDQDDVEFQARNDINIAETTILSTSDFYFSDLTDLKLGVSINGTSINLILGQVARTVGKVTTTDGIGAEWLVVAAGTGTADDDLFADLDNGLQVQKLRNQTPWTLDAYTAGGTADAITLTRKAENPKNTAYNTDQRYLWVASGTNTTAVTASVDGLGVKSVKHPDGTALTAGDIISSQNLEARYDGTNMVLLSSYSRVETYTKAEANTNFTNSKITNVFTGVVAGATGVNISAFGLGFYVVQDSSGGGSGVIHYNALFTAFAITDGIDTGPLHRLSCNSAGLIRAVEVGTGAGTVNITNIYRID